MSAATLTAARAGADLVGELREMLQRHDGATTLDEVRELADDLTAALRRTRGRIGRLARKAQPAPATKPEPERAAPAAKPAADPPKPAPVSTAPAAGPMRHAPRRIATFRVALAVVVVLCGTLTAGAARGARRLASAVKSAAHRAVALLGRGHAPPGAMPLPRPDEAPPLSAVRRSPLDVAAGLQSQKRYPAYRNTVLLWELGTRAYEGLEIVERAQ